MVVNLTFKYTKFTTMREVAMYAGNVIVLYAITYVAMKYFFLPLLDPQNKLLDGDNAGLVISKLLGVKRNRKRKQTEKEEQETRAKEESDAINMYQSLNKHERLLAVRSHL
jgi:hypothetical protein